MVTFQRLESWSPMLMQEMMSMLGRMNHGIIALLSAMMQENRHLLGGNCLNDYK